EVRLNNPQGVAVATNGDVYLADTNNYRVRKLSGGVLTTVAGSGSTTMSFNANPLQAGINPRSVAVDNAGNVYILSGSGAVVYQLSTAGVLSVVAGTQGSAGFVNGIPGTGRLNNPYQIAIGADGSLYIADYSNQRVRKVQSTTPGVVPVNGAMTTIAGGGSTAIANLVSATAASL